MIVIAGKATVRPEHWDKALQQTQQMTAASEAEPGCRSYRFYVEPTNRNTFFIFEQWDSAEALTSHFQSTHYQEFGTFLASVLAAAPEILRYEVLTVAPL
jgi:quinol monooxygenase YgiN